MSLAIDTNRVTRVLLIDGWHDVEPGSFDLDSYEFGYVPDSYLPKGLVSFQPTHRGGESGVCATGFTFIEQGTDVVVYGPLTAVHAVEVAKLADPDER
jgi:hypothetical protein